MRSSKKYSKNDLAGLYDSCPIFKKYCQFNLWSEEVGEYDKVKYCETYLDNYISVFTQRHLLQCFSPSFLAILYTSPSFVKFVKSGFIKYIDFHFLLFFQSKSFNYSKEPFEEIEIFVEEYFQRYSRKVFEEDLLKCLVKAVNELVPKSLQGFVDSRLKVFYHQKLSAQLTEKALSNSVMVENNIFASRKPCGYRGLEDKAIIAELFFNSFFQFGTETYKSLGVCKYPLSAAFTDFYNIVLADTIHGWGLYFGGFNNNQINQFVFIESFIDKTSFVFNYFLKSNTPEYTPEIFYLLSRGYEWCFYTFLDVAYKPLTRPLFFGQNLKLFNKDVHTLLELFVEDFDNFVNEDNDIDIPIHKNTIIKGDLEPCFLASSPAAFENLLKVFDNRFSKYSNKSHINFSEYPLVGNGKPTGATYRFENLARYLDNSYLDISLDFQINIEELAVGFQKSSEEAALCPTDNFKGIRSDSEDILIETFEAISTFSGEVPTETFENIEKILMKPYAYSPAVKKPNGFLSSCCLEDAVTEWDLYSGKCTDISNKLGLPSSDSLFSLNKNPLTYQYFYRNVKKVSGWESSFLVDCHFIWGICNCDAKNTLYELYKSKPLEV